MNAKRNEGGFTLLETMVVCAVTAIVCATVAPGLAGFIDGRRLDGVASRLAADVQWVRTEAVAGNRPLRLGIQAGTASTCWIVHTGLPGQCACGSGGAPSVCTGGARALKSVVVDAGERVSVQANVASMLFDPLHGTSTPTGTLRVLDRRGREIHHVVNVMGRTRSCSPGAAVPGYRAC